LEAVLEVVILEGDLGGGLGDGLGRWPWGLGGLPIAQDDRALRLQAHVQEPACRTGRCCSGALVPGRLKTAIDCRQRPPLRASATKAWYLGCES